VSLSPGVVQVLREGKGFYHTVQRAEQSFLFSSLSFSPRPGTISDPGCHGRLSVGTGTRGAEGERLSGTCCTGVKGGSLRLQFPLFILLSDR